MLCKLASSRVPRSTSLRRTLAVRCYADTATAAQGSLPLDVSHAPANDVSTSAEAGAVEAGPDSQVQGTTDVSESQPSQAKPKKRRQLKAKKERKAPQVFEPLKPLEESASYQHFLAYQLSKQGTPAVDIARAIDDLCTPNIPHRFMKTYPKLYESLRTRLENSFSKEQLRSYCESNGVPHTIWGASTTKKQELTDAILVHVWGWTSLEALTKELADLSEIIPRCESLAS